MSQHISIGPETVLAAHARPPTATGSHSLARTDSAPHLEQNFFSYLGLFRVTGSLLPLVFRSEDV